MTKEKLEQRKTELREQYEQKLSDLHAIQGAVQDCNYWLSELAKSDGSKED
jgi:hypothetical protein